MAEWVKGHSTTKKKSIQEELNIIANALATDYHKHPNPLYKPSSILLRPPTYAVQLLYEGSVITSKLYHTMSTSLHTNLLIAHIMKKSKWSHRIFDMVDWDSHSLAFHRLSCQRKISTAKLIHQLLNTNRQNHIYYGDSPTCPCCK
jgi:hypothetical protein